MATIPQKPPPAVSSGRKYVRAVGPKLRVLLYFLFGLVALLGANSGYLASITALEAATGETYQNYFYQFMFLGHLALGLVLIVPFLVFGIIHLLNSRNRRNRRAVRVGYALFTVSIAVLVSGLLLMRVGGLPELRHKLTRDTVYWLHVACPLFAAWLYWLHRLAGPRIKWKLGGAYLSAVGIVVLAMLLLHKQDPRKWNVAGNPSGAKYFHPSVARTSDGNFIPADVLMMDQYCLKCHQDAYQGWFHSSHHLSSFNNPPYFSSVRETREVALKRDGSVQASRWCAGCHDPVPFFSGQFDNPEFDMVNHPTSQAGITCTVCHAISHVNSTKGNADYTIEEPIHYPFAFSNNPVLQFINQQLVKAKPAFHKKQFLKPLHKTAEFCSTCHKVSIPHEVNHYKEFLRGQNHYDSYLLSGVGHGARSFYYPEKAVANCAGCHMKPQSSGDFGARDLLGAGGLEIHNHAFPAANTGIAWLKDAPDMIRQHQEFLKDVVRVDLFGIKEGRQIEGHFSAPLRPVVPILKPGGEYLLETVIRTLKIGHPLTQGTVDSNELWLEVTVKSGDRLIGKSGGINKGEVDPWSHFVNVFMLDREGNRIDRRNPQDIFVPLYNHQVLPGAGQVVHYGLRLPEDLSAPVEVELKLNYRKFDQQYMDFVTRSAKPGDHPIRGHTPGEPYINPLPVTVMATDRVVFPVEGVRTEIENAPSAIPPWQRWNDCGIGLFLGLNAAMEGGIAGSDSELRQSAGAFAEVEKLGRFDGPLNLARVYLREGRLDEAVDAIARAAGHGASKEDPPAPAWTIAWLSGLINRQQGQLEKAVGNFQSVLNDRTAEMTERGFDFSLDYEVINDLGQTLFDLAKREAAKNHPEEAERYLREAAAEFEKTLAIDSENVTAHYGLELVYRRLAESATADEQRALTTKAEEHRVLHARYKPDDNARDLAINKARQKYPAANHAAEAVVIYPLNRAEAIAGRIVAPLDGSEVIATAARRDGESADLAASGPVADEGGRP